MTTSLKQVDIVMSTYMNPTVTTNKNKKIQQIHKNQKERNTSILLKKIIRPQGKKQKEEMNKEEL